MYEQETFWKITSPPRGLCPLPKWFVIATQLRMGNFGPCLFNCWGKAVPLDIHVSVVHPILKSVPQAPRENAVAQSQRRVWICLTFAQDSCCNCGKWGKVGVSSWLPKEREDFRRARESCVSSGRKFSCENGKNSRYLSSILGDWNRAASAFANELGSCKAGKKASFSREGEKKRQTDGEHSLAISHPLFLSAFRPWFHRDFFTAIIVAR